MKTKRGAENEMEEDKINYLRDGVLALRMRVDLRGAKVIKPDVLGIVCAGVFPQDGLPPLVVVADDSKNNHGMSLTNGVDCVLAHLSYCWGNGFPFTKANFVEIDSMGFFDHIVVSWEDKGQTPARFTPMRWPGAAPRTLEAFLGVYGIQGPRALKALKDLDFVPVPHHQKT